MATISWLGHASFMLQDGGTTVYIDPWKLKSGSPKADLILISHSHYDHLSPDDVAAVQRPDTDILCARDCTPRLKGRVKPIAPGETVTIKGATITATRAYNPAKKFHPKSNDWLGFLISLGGEVIYYAGDTDVIPEMQTLGRVDVALLPIGGTYTMSAVEAAEAAGKINAKKCIPYHWGDIVGSRADAETFKKLCRCPVEIL